jgi:hypothetical protein
VVNRNAGCVFGSQPKRNARSLRSLTKVGALRRGAKKSQERREENRIFVKSKTLRLSFTFASLRYALTVVLWSLTFGT